MQPTTTLARFRVLVLATVMAATSFAVTAAPSGPRPTEPASDNPLTSLVRGIEQAIAPVIARAAYCATEPSFTGYLTPSATSTTAVGATNDPDVFGYVSNVSAAWSCTAYFRYSGVAWNTSATVGVFDWGMLINSTAVSCNWGVGTDDYLKANNTTDCPDTDDEYALEVTLDAPRTYVRDVAHNGTGDFSFMHTDCASYYGSLGENIKTGETFSAGNVNNRPGANCDPLVLDDTGTSQTITYDTTAPAVNFDTPDEAASLAAVTYPGYQLQIDATDAASGFAGANGWTTTRQVAAWDGSTCGTFVTDTGAGSVMTGTVSANDQIVQQFLPSGSCYRWTLSATDAAGNVSSTTTSGPVRRIVDATLGVQGYQQFETWDLGAGDTLGVNVATGNVVISHPIVSLPMRGGAFDLDLTYNSQATSQVGMGQGWQLSALRRLTVSAGTGNVTLTDSDGARYTFTSPTGSGTVTYTRPDNLYATLVRDTTATPDRFTLTYRDQSVDIFDELSSNTGYLKEQQDRFGNTVTFAYSGTNLATATDPAGRVVTFSWTTVTAGDRLTSITDWANVSSGVVQTSGSGNRTHRFFYNSTTGELIGWARPLDTSGTCMTAASHRTCLTYTGGLVSQISRKHTYSTLSSGVIGSATRTLNTTIGYAGGDARSVTDAMGEETVISRPSSGQLKVVRPGTPASETTYGLVASSDALGRVQSIWRKLGAGTIEQRTLYDATYVVEPASVTDNYVNGVIGDGSAPTVEDRKVSYTYVASSLGLVSRVTEPLDGSNNRTTDYLYNSNNDVTSKTVALNAGATKTVTRYCYHSTTCNTSDSALQLYRVIENYKDGTAGGSNGHVEDVVTAYQYDGDGQRTRETRSNYAGGGTLLDSRAIGYVYDSYGNVTSQITNYVDGAVTDPGDDIDPNATTNARTDLTTTYGYDSAGNQVSVADPRRAIALAPTGASLAADDYVTRTVFDAHNQAKISQLPTTPSGSDCTPATATCRQSERTYDELGLLRLARDLAGKLMATKFNHVGRAVDTYQDDDGAGAGAAVLSGRTGYDASGRILWSEDWIQANDVADANGRTEYTYDELGQTLTIVTAAGTAVESTTASAYDALGRVQSETAGYGIPAAQTTAYAYDIGGRATQQSDEFTCSTSTYDYRDLVTATVEGKTTGSPCTGSGTRTINFAYDGLGRLTARTEGSDTLEGKTYDAAGNVRKAWSTTGTKERATEYTRNALDQVTTEYAYTDDGGLSDQTWARANRDGAGNETDRCLWTASPPEWCKPAGGSFASPVPKSTSSTEYDARNMRISLFVAGIGTTTYDPDANYQISGVYLATGGNKEHQTLYTYDARDRLDTIQDILCHDNDPLDVRPICPSGSRAWDIAVNDYDYDDNNNRTKVTENNGSGAVTRYYCYDAQNRLSKVSTSSASCSAGVSEWYTYDEAGNRTEATGRDFTYDGQGQLDTCTGTSCAPVFDNDGRLIQITLASGTWRYEYDDDGRLVKACNTTTCPGSGVARLEFAYDSEGRRTTIKEIPASGTPTETTFSYEGSRVVREVSVTGSTTVTRNFTIDETGAIRRVAIASTPTPNAGTDGDFLVLYNGHGDALWLASINSGNGQLTRANRFHYTTWGTPTTTNLNGFSDLEFRYRYVGQFDVQWDGYAGAGLTYMHARHYHPEFARFLQPDPSDLEANLYSYAENSPVTLADPSGCLTCKKLIEKIYNLVLSIYEHIDELKKDKWTLGWWVSKDPNKPNMTVDWHQQRIRNDQRRLADRIEEFYRGRCGGGSSGTGAGYSLPRDVWKVVKAPVPGPRNRPMPPRPNDIWGNLLRNTLWLLTIGFVGWGLRTGGGGFTAVRALR